MVAATSCSHLLQPLIPAHELAKGTGDRSRSPPDLDLLAPLKRGIPRAVWDLLRPNRNRNATSCQENCTLGRERSVRSKAAHRTVLHRRCTRQATHRQKRRLARLSPGRLRRLRPTEGSTLHSYTPSQRETWFQSP